jgi:acetyl-CoA synthetase
MGISPLASVPGGWHGWRVETRYSPIRDKGEARLLPNLQSYDQECAVFDWNEAESALSRLPGGGWNIAHEAVDRHAFGPRGDQVAIRWLGRKGETRDITYAALAEATSRFASGLHQLGVDRGDRVFTLSSRVPELYITTLGTLKNGSVAAPLFSAFGPEPIETRFNMGEGRVLVTTEALYRRKIEPIRERLESLQHVILVGGAVDGTISFEDLLKTGDPETPSEDMTPEDMALLHFTSGTTGMPKGAVHVHGAVLHHYLSAHYALDLHPGDIYWCTADPGWVTGTSYGIIAPLTHGVTCIVDEGEFDAERWYRTIEQHRVSVWYTAPTAIRMLMKAGAELAREFDLSSLRFIASVGEPLNPEAVVWGVEALGRPIHDNWWQTETGGIMIANFAAEEIRPGSMGRPLPGIEAAILRRTDQGEIVLGPDSAAVEEEQPLTEGELALRPGWPSMFRGYLGMEERYAKSFQGGWYRSGDLAERDEDGYYWFVGRGDDVIKSAGHLIGPFEVESALMEHPAVAEAGVIGKPDEVAGEVVKAFVSLNPGYEWSAELNKELIAWGRVKLGAAVAPREIDLEPNLPHTRSGKIMRRLLKAWELGLPTGDTSTLEGQE